MKQHLLLCLLLVFGVKTYGIEKELVLVTKTGGIYGTLLSPDEDAKKEIVALLICGSGPTDRDGNSHPLQMVNNSIKYLAEDLSQERIPSLRYDKRAIAKSGGAAVSEDVLRFNTYVEDARAWIDLLAKEYDKVLVIGHSEGAMLGVMAAINNPKVSSLVLLAGCGRPADEVLKEQLSTQPPVVTDVAFPIIDSLKMGKTQHDVPPMFYALFRPSVQPYLISWFAVDPVAEINKVNVPILIVQGDKDIQVQVKDADLLHQANKKATKVIIPNMNHVLKECSSLDQRIQMPLYNTPTLKNISQLSASVIEFIQNNK